MNCEFGALARPLAVGFNLATVKLDKMSHYCEAQAKPAVLASGAAVALAESIEDYRQEVRLQSPADSRCAVSGIARNG